MEIANAHLHSLKCCRVYHIQACYRSVGSIGLLSPWFSTILEIVWTKSAKMFSYRLNNSACFPPQNQKVSGFQYLPLLGPAIKSLQNHKHREHHQCRCLHSYRRCAVRNSIFNVAIQAKQRGKLSPSHKTQIKVLFADFLFYLLALFCPVVLLARRFIYIWLYFIWIRFWERLAASQPTKSGHEFTQQSCFYDIYWSTYVILCIKLSIDIILVLRSFELFLAFCSLSFVHRFNSFIRMQLIACEQVFQCS